jgi:hypothetical protein
MPFVFIVNSLAGEITRNMTKQKGQPAENEAWPNMAWPKPTLVKSKFLKYKCINLKNACKVKIIVHTHT